MGYPNAGKSNIIEALSFFDAISNDRGFKLSSFVRFQSLQELFFESNIRETIYFKKDDLNINLIKNSNSLSMFIEPQGGERIYEIDKKGYCIENIGIKTDVKRYLFETNSMHMASLDKFYLNTPYGENLAQVISSFSEIRNDVRNLLANNNLKLLIEKNTNELKIFKEFEDGTVFTLPYSMIADTLQRLIFYKTAIMSNKDSVLLFEEPEAHCFEPYILEFTNAVKYDENNNQYFIVTHSQFVIDELLRDEESRNNTQIYLVNNIENKTQVKKLNEENNDDVYQYGMNVFFNFENLWQNN